ncbi:MAG: GuaB3 family IMP dehydrogenase-related protein [Acidimicrobiales bacterium]
MAEIDIGMGKSARRAYSFDDITIVPSRRTRDPEDIDLGWEIDAYRFDVPFMASAMDSVVSPATAIEIGRLGGVGVLNLEGLWTRYADADAVLADIAELDDAKAMARMQDLYAAPVDPDLILERIAEINAADVVSCAAISPQRTADHIETVLRAELGLLVIQQPVISAEHVSRNQSEPLNLKTFIRRLEVPVIVGDCASYSAALHLMRTGAAGVLVGVGTGAASTVRDVLGIGGPQATALADARAARMRHLDETGVYTHIIADGSMATGGDIAKAVACGADAVMLGAPLAAADEAPGRGWHWGVQSVHPTVPQGGRVSTPARGSLAEIIHGPSHTDDGALNLAGGLRQSMAMCGYTDLKDFQKAELLVGRS